MEVTEESVCDLTAEQKHHLLLSDPVTTARHFSKVSGIYERPITEVMGYFQCIAFQLRGSLTVLSEGCP